MDDVDDQDPNYEPANGWADQRPAWRKEFDERRELLHLPEWWETCGEVYDGAWLIRQGRQSRSGAVRGMCVARFLALQLCAQCIRRRLLGEDADRHIARTRSYIHELPMPRQERKALKRLLATLLPYNPVMTADELVGLSWSAERAGLDMAAHSCALMAYECALSCASDDGAAAACRALSHIAFMQECPRAARRWRGRAHVHMRRAQLRGAAAR